MESLYRKYRPKTFEDVVGQQHVVSTLEHAVLEGRTSHAYLFCGPRGTGKTTMARILAKALMCERGAGQLPDGTCENCQLIAAGEHPDVYELDAASRTGVDNVREEIIGRVSFAPVRGSYKVYIIDEVHMLTTAAFNALLKTLEEPPEHIVFVLCTTDPQKVPETILSRVQRFDFHAIGASDILGQLKRVCDAEGFSYDEAALELVVRHARGGMRDALSALEQLSTFGGGSVSLDAARDLLGEVSSSMLTELTGALARRDVPTVFARIGELVESGRDLLQLARELSAHLRDVYVASVVGEGASTLPVAGDELRQLKDEALAFGAPDRVARALAVMSEVSSEMRVATNQRLALEVALTRIARPKSDLTLDSLAERVAQLEKTVEALAAGSASVPMSTTPASSLTAPALAPTAPAPTPPDPTPQASARQTISAPQVAPAPVHAERPEPQAPQPPTLEQQAQSTSQEPQQVPASVARQTPQELLTSEEAPLASPAQPAPQQRSSEGALRSDQTTGAGAAQQSQPLEAAVQPRKETAPATPAVTPATPAVPPAVADRLVGETSTASILWVRTSGDASNQIPVSAVRKALAGTGLYVADSQEGRVNFTDQVRQVAIAIGAMLVFTLLIALSGLANTITISVLERTRELGVLRATGAQRKEIRLLFITEAVLIALLGGSIGILLGCGVGIAGVAALLNTNSGSFLTILQVPWLTLILVLGSILLAATAVGILASLRPAESASRIPPIHALAQD